MEKVKHGATSVVRHLENEDSLIFRRRRWRCVRRRITSCATVLLRLFPGGIGPKSGTDGPSVHGVFSADSQSAYPCLLSGRPIHAPCLFGGWFIGASCFLGGWPIGAQFLLCGGGRYGDGEDPSMTASLQCAQCTRFKTQQKLHDVLKYDLFWRV